MTRLFTIAIHGDSLTVDRSARNWPIILERTLQQGRDVRVRTILTGREGQSSGWGLSNLQPVINLRPDVAIIAFINDANPAHMNLATSEANCEAIIDAIAAGSPGTAIFLATICRPTAAAVSATFPNLTGLVTQLNAIATDKGVGMIDCYAAWGDPASNPSEYAEGDGIHPLLAGLMRVTVPTVAAEMASLIDE